MKKDKNLNNSIHVGPTYLETMSLILFTLKLLGVISCSWWIVFLPILAGWAFVLLLIAFGLLFGGMSFVNKIINRS